MLLTIVKAEKLDPMKMTNVSNVAREDIGIDFFYNNLRARDCQKVRSPRRNRRYSNSRSRYFNIVNNRHHRRRSDSRSRSSYSSSRSRRRSRDHRNRRRYSNSPKRGEEQKKSNYNKSRSPSDS